MQQHNDSIMHKAMSVRLVLQVGRRSHTADFEDCTP